MTAYVPESFEQVTLGQFMKWHNAGSEQMRLMAATGLSGEDVRNIRLDDIPKVLALFEAIISNPKGNYKPKIVIDDREFAMIPNFRNITGAEYFDLLNFTDPKNIQKTLPKAMCVLYRPIVAVMGDKYAIEKYDSTVHLSNEEYMLKMTMDAVEGVLSFFTIIAADLLTCSLTFLDNQMKEIQMMTEELKQTQD